MGIPERTKEGYEELRRILELNPEGYPLRRAMVDTGLAYPSVKNKVIEWGYIIIKKEVMVKRLSNIIVKKEG